jgi:hypothetical protein
MRSLDQLSRTTIHVVYTVNGHRPFGAFNVDLEVDSFDPGTVP